MLFLTIAVGETVESKELSKAIPSPLNGERVRVRGENEKRRLN
jgi:hypothetical protein